MGRSVFDDDQSIHALLLNFDPLLAEADLRPLIRCRVEILGRATVAIHGPQICVAGIGGRTAESQQLAQQLEHQFLSRRFHFQAKMRRLKICASDLEFLDFESALVFDHGIENTLHDVRVDQVSLGLDNFLHGVPGGF